MVCHPFRKTVGNEDRFARPVSVSNANVPHLPCPLDPKMTARGTIVRSTAYGQPLRFACTLRGSCPNFNFSPTARITC